jgi:phosphoribosyl 1,2-cyclic phosphate phosphodiesterase
LLKITFLGTGTSQGVPVIACSCNACTSIDPRDKRLRSSILIDSEGKSIIIDTGPDFREQMLRENIKNLDAILYTHEHKDHTAGLDDIRSFNYLRQKPMDVYAEPQVIRSLQMEYAYIFAEKKYPGVPQVEIHSIENQGFRIDGIDIIPIRVMHYRLPVLGFRIGDFTYITDANYISEVEKDKIIGTRYLVINGLRRQKHISHFSLEEALKLISELSPKRAYITHISHQMGRYEDVQKDLPAGIMLAYDGLQIEI